MPRNGNPSSDKKSAGRRYRIQVLDRAVQIMDCFAFDTPELSVAQLSAAVGLHKSTVHRILMALEHNGLVEQNPATSQYRLGLKLFKLGNQSVARLNLRSAALPYLRGLMEETGETVHLAILDNDQVLYLEKVEGPHALRMPSRVGRHIPTYCTSLGKAMLSCLDESEVRRIVRSQPIKQHTPNGVSSLKELLAELARSRKRGYALDNEEIELGLRCVGAPVRDFSGTVVGAISIAGPSARLGRDEMRSVSEKVKLAAIAISEELGFDTYARGNQ